MPSLCSITEQKQVDEGFIVLCIDKGTKGTVAINIVIKMRYSRVKA
jgi:hypothetical protein